MIYKLLVLFVVCLLFSCNDEGILVNRGAIVDQITTIDSEGNVLSVYEYDVTNQQFIGRSPILARTVGNEGSPDGIQTFPGDLESSEENETGGRNVTCRASNNHCYTSRFR